MKATLMTKKMKTGTMIRSLVQATLPVLAATIVVSGQTTQGSKAPEQTQGPVFRAAADYVSTDLFVWDSQGRFVPNLKQSQFEVLEDGVPQDIAFFSPIVGGRQLAAGVVSAHSDLPEGIIAPAARQTPDTSGRIFVVFLDDLHIEPALTPQVRQMISDLKDNLIHPGDLITIVSTGPSSIEINATYDLNRLDEAKSKFMGGALSPDDIINAPDTTQGPPMIRYNVRTAFSTAYDLLTQLEKVTNKRKTFVYVSSGYDFNPYKDSRLQHEQELFSADPQQAATHAGAAQAAEDFNLTNPFMKQGQQFAETDLVQELAELTRAANRANTSFYTFDPRGLMTSMPPINTHLTSEEWREFVDISQSSLRVLADETGGKAFVNMNDWKKGMREMDNDTSDYYMLGYYTKNPDPLKRVRHIQIKVAGRTDLTLKYRTQYALKIPAKK